jgi:hypothetical protein
MPGLQGPFECAHVGKLEALDADLDSQSEKQVEARVFNGLHPSPLHRGSRNLRMVLID